MNLPVHSRTEEIALFVVCLLGVTIWGNFLYHFLDRIGVFKRKGEKQ